MLTIIWSTSVTGGRFAVEPARWLKLAVGMLCFAIWLYKGFGCYKALLRGL